MLELNIDYFLRLIPNSASLLVGIYFLFNKLNSKEKKLDLRYFFKAMSIIYMVDIFIFPFILSDWPMFSKQVDVEIVETFFTQWPTIKDINEDANIFGKIVLTFLFILLTHFFGTYRIVIQKRTENVKKWLKSNLKKAVVQTTAFFSYKILKHFYINCLSRIEIFLTKSIF